MAILVNVGQRGFILKEGFLAPTQQLTVDQETANKLCKMYPQELKMVIVDKPSEAQCEGPKVVEEKVEEPVKEEPVAEKPKKATRKRSKKEEVK